MGKTLTCPFCNNKDTLKVVYCYRGYKRKNNDLSNLVKDGTIYRNEKPRFEKYDFDGEKITATLYNKYCPNCQNYFHSIGKMAVIDIDKVTLIYEIENSKYRYDFDFSNNQQAKYNCKYNYVLVAKDIILSDDERYDILKSIKKSKMNFWNKEYNNKDNYKYKWIIKLEYHNGLSECFFGYDQVSDNWNSFISGFKNIIYKYDNEKLIDRLYNKVYMI